LSVAFDKNTKIVAVGGSDAEIKIISVERGEMISSLKAHEDAVNGVTFNQENNTLYSISNDGTVRTWK
jgi:WD40 repeat protein